MKKLHFKNTGFSLVETLVSITILLIIIVGPMTISSNAANKTSFSSEQVIAFFLAQEGVELAQKTRDDLMLSYFPSDTDKAWETFTDSAKYLNCFKLQGCTLELNSDANGTLKSPALCNPLTNCNLYYDEAGKRSHYTYSVIPNNKTLYTRAIKLTKTASDEVKVVSTVTWNAGSIRKEQKAEVVTYLYKVY